jgi:hypothetical protein
MTTPQSTEEALPHLLRLLQNRPTGEIYLLSARQTVTEGLKACERPVITNASWSQNKSQLSISFGRIITTFRAEESRLLFSCSCNHRYERSHCTHVITAWACLKRFVSPTSLASVNFHTGNSNVIAGLARQQDTAPLPSSSNLIRQAIKNREQKTVSATYKVASANLLPERNAEPYRLLLSRDEEGYLDGDFCRGNEHLSCWTSRNLAPDVHAFLLKHPIFDGSRKYLDDFARLAKGSLQIILQDTGDAGIILSYCPKQPFRARLILDLKDSHIQIIPALDHGQPLPTNVIIAEQLLVDVDHGTIHPLTNSAIWDLCDQFLPDNEEYDDWDSWDNEQEDDWEDSDATDPDDESVDDCSLFSADDSEEEFEQALNKLNEFLHNGVTITLEEFNESGLLMLDNGHADPLQDLCLLYEKKSFQPIQATASYRLLAPDVQGDDLLVVAPQVLYSTIESPFSVQAFGFLSPHGSDRLTGLLRTKKRYQILLETAFLLAEELTLAERTRLIRTALSTKEFIKRPLRAKATLFLEQFSKQCHQKGTVLTAHNDGWYLIREERQTQARMLKVLVDLFGAEAFVDDPFPGTIIVSRQELFKHVPELMTRLATLGARLEFGSKPVERSSLQFLLDATSSGLDWFELKPEISLNGELLTEDELHSLLEGSPILQKNGRLLLLDELSSQVLAMFSTAIAAKKGKKGKKELVRVPRLQMLDWLQLRKHGVTVQLAPQDAEVLESLLNFDQLPKPALPEGLVADVRHYQQDAWHWLAFLYTHRFGACLADDMGLGKTLQGITLMAGIMAGTIPTAALPGSPHLVVAPPSLLFNWEAEIARFCLRQRYCSTVEAPGAQTVLEQHDIIITSYGVVQRDHDKLQQYCFDVIIFDETQVVKNLQAATSNAVRKLKSAFNLALTGTPVENHLGEYFAIMDLCLPGLLGSHEEFNRQIAKGGPSAIQRLIQRTRPFVLRRTKQMIAAELPPKIETDIQLELSPKQKALYQRTIEEVKGQVLEAYQNHAVAQARIIALTAILRLRQICLAPVLAVPSAPDTSPKLEFLQNSCLNCVMRGTAYWSFPSLPAIWISLKRDWHSMASPVCAWMVLLLSPSGRSWYNLSGGGSTTDLSDQPKAGGKGLNLTRATYVYHMDPWWNPAVENQASDRAHRIGQTEQVTITRLIMRHTIEEKMMELKARKLELYKALLEDGSGSGGSALTREDFEFLLG